MKTLIILALFVSLVACGGNAEDIIIEQDRDEIVIDVTDNLDIELCDLQGGYVEFLVDEMVCVYECTELSQCTIGEAYTR